MATVKTVIRRRVSRRLFTVYTVCLVLSARLHKYDNLCLFYVFQLTVADLAVYNIFDTRVMNDPEALDSYPSLKANRKATESNPRIAAYLKVRKHTDV